MLIYCNKELYTTPCRITTGYLAQLLGLRTRAINLIQPRRRALTTTSSTRITKKIDIWCYP